MLRQDGSALWLVLGKPRPRLGQSVEIAECVEGRVGDDADAGGSRRESDQPHPVALAHQVIGGHRPVSLDEACLPEWVITPLADVDFGRDPQPDGIAVMLVGALEFELAGQYPVTPGRIDHPTCRRGTGRATLLNRKSVGLILDTEFDRSDAARDDLNAF